MVSIFQDNFKTFWISFCCLHCKLYLQFTYTVILVYDRCSTILYLSVYHDKCSHCLITNVITILLTYLIPYAIFFISVTYFVSGILYHNPFYRFHPSGFLFSHFRCFCCFCFQQVESYFNMDQMGNLEFMPGFRFISISFRICVPKKGPKASSSSRLQEVAEYHEYRVQAFLDSGHLFDRPYWFTSRTV